MFQWPSKWHWGTLDEFVQFRSGGTPNKQHEASWGGVIPWITAKDLKSLQLTDSIDHVTKIGAAKIRGIEAGSVLILVRGMALHKDVPIGLATCFLTFNQDVKALVPNKQLEPQFLLYYLLSKKNELLRNVENAGHGTGRLNTELLRSLQIPIPPLSEQRCIVNILATWDRAIETTKSLVAKKSKTLNVLSRELLFGEKRYGQQNKTNRSSHRWFSIPSEWAVVQVWDIARQITETNSQSERIPVLSCTKYDGLVNSLGYFDRQVFGTDISGYKVVARGQFAYATNHLEEGSIGYQDLYDRGLVSPMYTVFETNQKTICDGYLWKVFKTEVFLHVFRANTSASVNRRGGLRWDEFARIQVPLPPLAEQTEINNVLNVGQREIVLFKNHQKALARQRDALASELLTGRLRVRDAEKLGAAAAG